MKSNSFTIKIDQLNLLTDLKTAEAMGAGRSKKEAKHQAARNLIDKLTGIQISDQILPPTTAENTNNK